MQKGELEIPVPWLVQRLLHTNQLAVDVKGTGTGSVTATEDQTGKWCYSTAFELEVEGQLGVISAAWSHEWSAGSCATGGASLSGFQKLDTDTSVILSINPFVGTTNVYSGNPVLADVGTNVVEDGTPCLTTTESGETFLAWMLDSPNPTNWLGNSVQIVMLESNGWSTPIEISNSRGFNSDVKMASDSSGNLIAVWAMASSACVTLTNSVSQVLAAMGSNNIVYSVFDGVQWSVPLQITGTTGTESDVVIAPAPTGNLMTVWLSDDEGTNSIYASMWNGLVWAFTLFDCDWAQSSVSLMFRLSEGRRPCSGLKILEARIPATH